MNKYAERIANLGFSSFVKYTWHQKTKLPKSGEFQLTSKYASAPLSCRGGTSDIDVFKHIYVIREYSCLEHFEAPELIIDCGANAGFSTSYLLNNFPTAKVVAVEPDQGNFKMLCKNTESFGERCIPINAGVWSKNCGLKFSEIPFGDGREWAVSVREAKDSEESDVKALDVASLIKQSGLERVTLLKIDIEGSEDEVFNGSHTQWIDQVDNIIIEIHGEESRKIYTAATDAAGFSSVDLGGLTLSTRK